jgi:DHA1 family multidrug resistance protein-like MFS transporter
LPTIITTTWSRVKRHPVIIALGVIALLAELGYATMNQSALQPYVDKELHLGAAWLGWIMAAFLLVEAAFRPPLGALGDRIGRKPLLVAGPIASCLSALFIARAANPGVIMALRVLDGIGAAAIWPTAYALVGDTVEERNRSVAMSVLNVTYMAGIALGPLLGGVISDHTGTQKYVFLVVSGLFALTFVVALLFLPKHEPPHKSASSEHPSEFKFSNLLYCLRAIPEMLVMVFFAFFAIGLLIPIAKLYAMDVLKLTETGFGVMLVPVAAILAVLAMPLGRVGDKWGKTQAVRTGVTLTATAMWLIATIKIPHTLLFAGALLGIGFLMAMPAWMALVSQFTSSANRGQVLGAVGMAQGFGAILGAVLGGYLYAGRLLIGPIDRHSAPLFLSAVALTVAAGMTFVFVRERRLK